MRLVNKHILTFLSLDLMLLAAIVFPATELQAQEQQCFDGEYVLGVSSIPALRDKAVEALEDASGEDLKVIDANARILVVKDEDLPTQSRKVVKYNPHDDACKDLRRAKREMLQDYREGDAYSISRRVSCSCNAVMQVRAPQIPNDPGFQWLWGMHQAGNDIDIDAPEAWEIHRGSGDVVVAVIDTGVDYSHPDLNANMWRNPWEIAGNGIDDDYNGYVDDVYGINAILNNGNPADDHSHGTHCAGTIGARANDNYGVAGVNWNVQIMGCKFLASSGGGSLADAIQCIDYVTMMKSRGVNVKLSSNSWGYDGGVYAPLYDAINRARSAGILFVAAAGNSGANCDQNTNYGQPGSYDLDNIISVVAVDSNGQIANFSNRGANCTDIAAPGVSIYSSVPTWKSAAHSYMSGTSMAAPHVAGAVALLASYAPSLSWTQLRDLLFQSGVSMASLQGQTKTGKMLNLYNLLHSAPSPDPNLPTPTNVPTMTPRPTNTPTPPPTPTAVPTSTPTPQPGYFTISGTAYLAGVAVGRGVKVKIKTANGDFVAYTDSNGRYTVRDILGPVNYVVEPSSSGSTWYNSSGYLYTNLPQLNLFGYPNLYSAKLEVLDAEKSRLDAVEVMANGSLLQTDASGQVTLMLPYGESYSFSAFAKSGFVFKSETLSGQVHGALTRRVVALPQVPPQ